MDKRNTGKLVTERLISLADSRKAIELSRFFKTGKGEYGEDDKFLGIQVPVTRSVIREFRHDAGIADVMALTSSQWHEVRLAGFLMLVEIYAKSAKNKDESTMRKVVDVYLSILDRGNNWDLVDLVAPKILGDYLVPHPEERELLYHLAGMDGKLWHQRTAIVSTWTLICHGVYADTFRLCEILMDHRHDLIHKACGWMLREAGKRGALDELRKFLDLYATAMPRTMLRYAIERFSADERKHYLALKPKRITKLS